MKKKIAILGSTGSIGESTLSIVEKNKKDFEVILLSTNKNFKGIKKQCKKFKPKFLIITNNNAYLKFVSQNNKKIKVFNSYRSLKKIFKKKIDYTINAISGFDGLEPTLEVVPYTKT